MKKITLTHQVPDTLAGQRLDVALSQLFPDYSRNQIQQWIREGYVQLDHKIIQKPRHEVRMGQTVIITAQITENTQWEAQAIPLNIVYEDETLIVINKPVG